MDAHHHVMILFHKLLARLHGTPAALSVSPGTINELYALLAAAVADPGFFETQRARCEKVLEDLAGSIGAADAEAEKLYADIRDRLGMAQIASPPTF